MRVGCFGEHGIAALTWLGIEEWAERSSHRCGLAVASDREQHRGCHKAQDCDVIQSCREGPDACWDLALVRRVQTDLHNAG